MVSRSLRHAALALLASTVGVRPAGAELAVMVDGSVLKIEGYESVGDRMRLELPEGGILTISMRRLDRIVDDEVAVEHEPPLVPPGFTVEIRFLPAQKVPKTPFGQLIFDTAKRHQINPQLVAAVVRAESAFDPNAVSRKGARGLMQLMPTTGARYGVEMSELFEPEKNLEAGTSYLRKLLDYYDELPVVLAAFNAGEGTVRHYRGIPPFRETREYIRRVYSFLGAETPEGGR